MIRTVAAASFAFAALVLACPAAAQAPDADVDVGMIVAPNCGRAACRPSQDLWAPLPVTPPPADDFIVIADLRLPTLGDLSKERWNQVHRRYDSGRGRREKIRA